MTFEYIDPDEMLERLLDDEGPFLSIYLPYGIPSLTDERMRIDRKNTIIEAKRKLEKATDDYWHEVLSEIESASGLSPREANNRFPPCTDVYIASRTHKIKATLPNALRPHFSFAAYAEIEPLVYYRWANEPYRIFKIDLEDPKILQGIGFVFKEVDIKFPVGLADQFGDSLEDYKYKTLTANLQWSKRDKSSQGKNDDLGRVGSLNRQTWDHDGNLSRWLEIISELFRARIKQESIETPVKNYIVGEEEFCRRFVELNPWVQIGPDEMIATQRKEDNRTIVQQVLHKITDKKLAAAGLELENLTCHENVNEIVDLLNARQINKLFVQQDDWFAKDFANNGRYEFSNPRSSILTDALKNRAKVLYTRNKIDNKQGLAGLSYKGNDYLWNPQKDS